MLAQTFTRERPRVNAFRPMETHLLPETTAGRRLTRRPRAGARRPGSSVQPPGRDFVLVPAKEVAQLVQKRHANFVAK